MSGRIVVNLEQGLAQSAIDRTSGGGTWLSIRQGREVVIVKLSLPSLQALSRTLAKELGSSTGETPGQSADGQAPAAVPADDAARPARGSRRRRNRGWRRER